MWILQQMCYRMVILYATKRLNLTVFVQPIKLTLRASDSSSLLLEPNQCIQKKLKS